MINRLMRKIYRHGIIGSLKILTAKPRRQYWNWRVSGAPVYAAPNEEELSNIEQDFIDLGISIINFQPSLSEFKKFQDQGWFPIGYHGGVEGAVWDEKLLEHWIAADKLGLMDFRENEVYVDVAAASSPWAKALREKRGINSFAIDLGEIGDQYRNLSYYRVENATQTSFQDASVKGVSLHCAFEMFVGDDDVNLIYELARILQYGGKAVILPLYMHTHHCGYSTAEYYGKGYADDAAKEYVRQDCSGIPFSRKYDANLLKYRILDTIESLGMRYQISILRNKEEFRNNIYCHFILEIEK